MKIIRGSFSLMLILVLGVSTSFAQNDSQQNDGWNFRISPYFWFVGFKGSIYRPPEPPAPAPLPEPRPPFEIDVSFRDISSSIKFAFMGAGEYRAKRFITQFNIASVILEGEAITPLDLILQNVTYRFGYVSGDISAGYFFVKNTKLEIAGLLGFKFIYFDIGGSTNLIGQIPLEGARSVSWVDPILGFRTKYKPHPRIEIVAYGDTDGRLIGDDLNYQFIGVVSYNINSWFLVSTGYRLWGLDTETSDAIYSGQVSGAFIRIGFQF